MDTAMARKRPSLRRTGAKRANRTSIATTFGALTARRKILVLVVAFLALWTAWQAFLVPVRAVVGRGDPALSHRITGDPAARLKLLLLDGLRDPEAFGAEPLRTAALDQLRREPLDAQALRSLAYHAQQTGNKPQARTLAQTSVAVSKRDPLAQLLLAQYAAEAGDDARAVAFFDTALRTSNAARPMIFQAMIALPDNASLFEGFVPLATDESLWIEEFILFAARNDAQSAQRATRMLLDGKATDNRALTRRVGGELLTLLFVRENYALMPPLLQRMGAAIARNPALEKATIDTAYGPFAWSPVEQVNGGASLVGGTGEAVALSAYAPRNQRAVVARRVLAMPAGRYRLAQKQQVVTPSAGGAAHWTVSCLSGETKQQIWTSGDSAGGPAIGAECPMQLVELSMAGGSDPAGFEVLVSAFDLLPATTAQ